MKDVLGLVLAAVLVGWLTYLPVYFEVKKALSQGATRWQATRRAAVDAIIVNAVLGLLAGIGILAFGLLAKDPAGYGKAFFTMSGVVLLFGGPIMGVGAALMGLVVPCCWFRWTNPLNLPRPGLWRLAWRV